MRKTWDIKELDSIVESNITGLTKGSREQDPKHKYKYVKMNNITKHNSFDLNFYTCVNATEEESSKFNLVDGDFLFNTRNSHELVGKSCLFTQSKQEIVLFNNNIMRIRFINGINPYFVNYAFSTPEIIDQLTEMKSGSTNVAAIYYKDLKKLRLPIPSLDKQKFIVSILDEAFAAIANAKTNTEKNLQNAKELFESYLQSVFANPGKDWEEKTLEQISTTFGRGKSKHRPRNYEKLYGGNYPFIQTGDIRNSNHYITAYTQTYSELGLKQSKLWPAGTICITIAANIAETGVLTFDACFPDSVIGLVVNEKLADQNFVEYLLQSFKARIQALGKGSAQANINMGTFETEKFPFPSVKEQQIIVRKLDAMSTETKKLETIYQSKLNDLEELKKSILQKAFAGELKNLERELA